MHTRSARLVLLFALTCSGTNVRAEAGWTPATSITELAPHSHQKRYVVKLALEDNPSGCSTPDVFYQDFAAAGAAQMFSTLLEAASGGHQVRVYVTGRCALHGQAEIAAVSLIPHGRGD